MRGYWAKIILGMLGIALVGITAVSLAKQGTEARHTVMETAEPISIPLAFIPFNLNGSRVGSIRRLTFMRDNPRSVTGFRIRVEVSEPEAYRSLTSGCVMSVDNPTHLSTKTNFICQPVDSSLIEFGRVEVRAQGAESSVYIPLYLPASVVEDFRGGSTGLPARMNADSLAGALRRMADSLSNDTRVMVDSLRRVNGVRPPPP